MPCVQAACAACPTQLAHNPTHPPLLPHADLTEEQTKDFFAKFVQMWNAGLMAPKYYTGGAASAPLKRTSHTWGFAARGGGAGGGAGGSSKGVAAFLEDERARCVCACVRACVRACMCVCCGLCAAKGGGNGCAAGACLGLLPGQKALGAASLSTCPS